jgi:hypothetical protein
MKHLDFTADGVEVSKYMCLVSSQGHSKEMIADLFPKVKDPHGKRGITHGFFLKIIMHRIRQIEVEIYFQVK